MISPEECVCACVCPWLQLQYVNVFAKGKAMKVDQPS